MKDIPFEQIKRYLKVSKSAHQDNGPYTVIQYDGWFDVLDKQGTCVGQGSGEYEQ